MPTPLNALNTVSEVNRAKESLESLHNTSHHRMSQDESQATKL